MISYQIGIKLKELKESGSYGLRVSHQLLEARSGFMPLEIEIQYLKTFTLLWLIKAGN